MKTCNNPGYCFYKTLGASMYGCSYTYYCDFQAPRDSTSSIYYKAPEVCTCHSSIPCQLHPGGHV